MMKEITINVTERHIADGKCADMNRCAVSLALLEYEEYVVAHVGNTQIVIRDQENKYWRAAGLSEELQNFIHAFDKTRGQEYLKQFIQPASFSLTLEEHKSK